MKRLNNQAGFSHVLVAVLVVVVVGVVGFTGYRVMNANSTDDTATNVQTKTVSGEEQANIDAQPELKDANQTLNEASAALDDSSFDTSSLDSDIDSLY